MGLHLSRGQADLLRLYHDILGERAIPMGLISEADAGRMWDRHVMDSMAAATVFGEGDRAAFDLGSGAGLPGIVLAIVLPDCSFVLVESRRSRVGFLEYAVERLGLRNASVEARRAEELEGEADIATARAFAPLERSWAVAHGLLRPGGRLVYFAGRGLGDPVAAARSASFPEPPGDVRVSDVLDSSGLLVIMSRT